MLLNDVIEGDCISPCSRAGPPASRILCSQTRRSTSATSTTSTTTPARRPTTSRGPRSGLAAAARARLKPNGLFFLAIGDEFDAEHKVLLDELGLTMRNWIVWHYTFGVSLHEGSSTAAICTSCTSVADPKNYTFNLTWSACRRPRMTTYADRREPRRQAGRTTRGCCARRRATTHFQPESDTWFGKSRVCRHVQGAANHPCQMPEGGA